MWWHFEGSDISRKYGILFFQTIVFFYSLCHYLESIKDALSKCSGLVRAVVQCAQTWWPWRSRCIQERWALSALPRAGRLGYWASCKARGAVTNFYHTCSRVRYIWVEWECYVRTWLPWGAVRGMAIVSGYYGLWLLSACTYKWSMRLVKDMCL